MLCNWEGLGFQDSSRGVKRGFHRSFRTADRARHPRKTAEGTTHVRFYLMLFGSFHTGLPLERSPEALQCPLPEAIAKPAQRGTTSVPAQITAPSPPLQFPSRGFRRGVTANQIDRAQLPLGFLQPAAVLRTNPSKRRPFSNTIPNCRPQLPVALPFQKFSPSK